MTAFFWMAQAANGVTLVVTLAALLIVVWLGPRRWTNMSFACFLAAMCLWMGGSLVARLLVNVPALGGRPDLIMNWVALGFALLGIMLLLRNRAWPATPATASRRWSFGRATACCS